MTEKFVTYLAMGVALSLVVNKPKEIANGINKFAGGVAGIVTGIVGT